MTIRTINGAVRELHAQDPDCAITASLLRRLCRNGCLRYIKDGNRMLVNMDDIAMYFTQKLAAEGRE